MTDLDTFEATLVGLRVGGKYRVDRVLGRGGMGCVALGTHEALGQKVAIKFMLHGPSQDLGLTERFVREAQLAARLQSEHVVRVFDVGRLESGLPYMVMEYLEGRSLAEELEAKQRLPIPVAVDYLLQALEAIAEAHALGIVHRDLKPDNLFLAKKVGSSKTVKVLDFGISKMGPSEENASLTQTSTMLGSPLFMSPEQIRAAKLVDARSDIWSIGVVLYCLVEGSEPFQGESIGALFGHIQYVDPLAMTHAPAPLEAVIRKCLSRDVADRYPTVRHLADALQPFASAGGVKSIQVIRQVFSPGTHASSPPEGVGVSKAFSGYPSAVKAGSAALVPGPTPTLAFESPPNGPSSALPNDTGGVDPSLSESRVALSSAAAVPNSPKSSTRAATLAALVAGVALVGVASVIAMNRHGSSDVVGRANAGEARGPVPAVPARVATPVDVDGAALLAVGTADERVAPAAPTVHAQVPSATERPASSTLPGVSSRPASVVRSPTSTGTAPRPLTPKTRAPGQKATPTPSPTPPTAPAEPDRGF